MVLTDLSKTMLNPSSVLKQQRQLKNPRMLTLQILPIFYLFSLLSQQNQLRKSLKYPNISKNSNPILMEKNLMHRHLPNRLSSPTLLRRHLKSKRPSHAFKTRKLKPFRKS